MFGPDAVQPTAPPGFNIRAGGEKGGGVLQLLQLPLPNHHLQSMTREAVVEYEVAVGEVDLEDSTFYMAGGLTFRLLHSRIFRFVVFFFN